jgi:hypothetical protein
MSRMDVEVVEALDDDRTIVGRLLQLYHYDFSEFDGQDVNPHGGTCIATSMSTPGAQLSAGASEVDRCARQQAVAVAWARDRRGNRYDDLPGDKGP